MVYFVGIKSQNTQRYDFSGGPFNDKKEAREFAEARCLEMIEKFSSFSECKKEFTENTFSFTHDGGKKVFSFDIIEFDESTVKKELELTDSIARRGNIKNWEGMAETRALKTYKRMFSLLR